MIQPSPPSSPRVSNSADAWDAAGRAADPFALDRGPRAVDGRWDAVVIGAGFGGLGAALTLAERGARVLVCEALAYPGGCASTFRRSGYRFEAGATLFSGLAPGQLFGRWIERFGLDVEVDWIDPVVELRAPGLRLPVHRRRGDLVRRFAEIPGAPVERLRAFFAEQERLADALWELLDDPSLLPPLDGRALLRHAGRLPRTLRIARTAGRPLAAFVRWFGLGDFEPLRIYLDALCQITVQCSAREAEAPFALGAIDYFWRGTGHVRGGIGALAWGLVGAVRQAGGAVALLAPATAIERSGSTWRVHTRRGAVEAPLVLANLLPQGLGRLLDAPGGAGRTIARLGRRVDRGWGAAMLYRVARTPPGAAPGAQHLQIVQDPDRPFTEGNHLFASISSATDPERAPAGQRTVTVSTHVPLGELTQLGEDERGRRIEHIQERMRAGLAAFAPEWDACEHELTASPRTFERFTGRDRGYVGGVPRRAGWRIYRELRGGRIAPGLFLVGDSVFPGQSTLAAALGGVRVAERALRRGSPADRTIARGHSAG